MLSLPAKWKDTKMTAIELLIKEPELSYDDVGEKLSQVMSKLGDLYWSIVVS